MFSFYVSFFFTLWCKTILLYFLPYDFKYVSLSKCTYCSVLEVVKAVVCQNEPSSLPGFDTSTCETEGKEVSLITSTRNKGTSEHPAVEEWSSRQARQTDEQADNESISIHFSISHHPPSTAFLPDSVLWYNSNNFTSGYLEVADFMVK